MFRFIAADLRRHWAGVLAITLIVALATALGVIVTLQERALRLGSARAADAFDLVVGAPGSETQLVLSSVFLQAAPLPLLPGTVLAGLIADPRVKWAAPVGFGDFIEGSPIVGTTQALIDGLSGLSEGNSFGKLGEAVIGSNVEMRLGDTFHPQHGQAHEAGGVHAEITYRIVGRMAPTGTPWDRAVLVPIETVWQVHEHGAEPDHDAPASARTMVPTHEAEHHGPNLDARVDPNAIMAPDAPGVPAIVVKPRTIADAYKLRQAYRGDHSLAVFPAEVLTRLYGTLGDARFILSAVAMGAQALVGAAILLVVTVHIMQRQRQIGALRAFGAPRVTIFAIVWLEAFAIIGAGLLAGFGIGYVAARSLSGILTQASGVVLPVGFVPHDFVLLASLLAVSGVVASVPALLAYRQSPASALRA
ncbi:MAG TPA: FtsX-like permease family protein [Ancylobacter sp.]